MTITAWYMDTDEVSDQRLPHSPESLESVSIEALNALGVLSWTGLLGAGAKVKQRMDCSNLQSMTPALSKALTAH